MPTLRIHAEQAGERLDVVLARAYPTYSRAFLQKMVKTGGVQKEGAQCTPNDRVRPGETYTITEFDTLGTFPSVLAQTAANLPLPAPPILFEDEVILVIDKPAGMVVHPAPGHHGPTLIDWLAQHMGSKVSKIFTDPARLGLVHRLDKETSGVLIVAKSVESQTSLSRQFRDRGVQKTYAAFIEGIPEATKGIITAPVARSKQSPSRMAVSPLGRPSETSFEVMEKFGKEVSHVVLYPKTGRTHQIRVHMAALGHPILGDRTYGSGDSWRNRFEIRRTMLHAQCLEVDHPITGDRRRFEASWPADMKNVLGVFRKTLGKAAMLVLCLGIFAAAATEGVQKKAVKPASTRSGTESGAAIRRLSKEVEALKAQLETLSGNLSQIQNSMVSAEEIAPKLRGLEQAIAEVNGKTVSYGASIEELKTQALETGRKIKLQEDQGAQMRDQLDRLQQDLIQLRASIDAIRTPAAEPLPVEPAKRR